MNLSELLERIAEAGDCSTGEALEQFLTVADYTPGDWRVEDLDSETIPRVKSALIADGWVL